MKTHYTYWRLTALVAALVLVFACDDSLPTSGLDESAEDALSLGKGKPPGGGGGGGLTNWAFAASDGGKITVLSSDAGTSTTVAFGGDFIRYSPRFTQDGKRVAYSFIESWQPHQLRIVGTDGTNDRLLYQFAPDEPNLGSGFSWLPGSSRVIYVNTDYHAMFVLDTLATVTPRIQTVFTGGLSHVSPGPDMDLNSSGFQGPIVFSMWEECIDDRMDLYVAQLTEDVLAGTVTLDASSMVRLRLPDEGGCGGAQNLPAFSPDGNWIAFVDGAYCCGGQSLKRVSFGPNMWSSGERDPGVLFGPPEVIAATGSTPSLETVAWTPAWAPDGSWLLYQGAFRTKGPYTRTQLVRVRPDGSDESRFSHSVPGRLPDWNPAWCNDIDGSGCAE